MVAEIFTSFTIQKIEHSLQEVGLDAIECPNCNIQFRRRLLVSLNSSLKICTSQPSLRFRQDVEVADMAQGYTHFLFQAWNRESGRL